MDKNLETCGVFDEERDKNAIVTDANDDDDDYDEDENGENGSESGGGPAAVKEISAPYDMPHYPIEVEEHRKIVMPQLEQFAHKEFEERTKALPTVSSKDHLYLMDACSHPLHSELADHSAPNSGVTSHQQDTGSAGLATPVTSAGNNKDSSILNGGYDWGLRSPDAETDIDYVPHFQRVYISGSDCPLSGVSYKQLFFLFL